MSSIEIGSGVCLGFGGTNARYAECKDGDITNFSSIETPDRPDEFFGWMAKQALRAADSGHNWLVAGYPGPVSSDGNLVGPLTNVAGLSGRAYNAAAEMAAADPAAGRLLADGGFVMFNANDGNLAAHAAASRVGAFKYDRVAALIDGTGVGAGLAIRDQDRPDIYHASKDPLEIGHILLSADPADTFERRLSGPALEEAYGTEARDLRTSHPAWRRVGEGLGQLSMMLGLTHDVNLVVPCGGVGSGAADKYYPHLDRILTDIKEFGNGPQRQFMPEVIPVPAQDSQVFELYGAEGLVRDALTAAA